MSETILVTIPFTGPQRDMLSKAAASYGDEMLFEKQQEITEEQLQKASAVIGNVPPERLKKASHLSWLQLNSAGADDYVKKGVLPDGVTLTCATGSYGTSVSEYMVTMLLVMMKRIPQYLADQKAQTWVDEGDVASPAGKRVLIVGTGDIGLSFARRIRGFSLPEYPITISGVRRRAAECPPELDEIHPVTEIEEEVSRADVIAIALPGTPATYHFFNEALLKKCRKGSYLLNAGRGSAVENAALAKPETYENFAGIWLDVFEEEPLPSDSPLYRVPNLCITPHIAGKFHLDITVQNIAETALENYRAWKGDGTFRSVVDRKTGYAK